MKGGSDGADAKRRLYAVDQYPDAPRLELDQLLSQLITRAQDVLAAQDRLRGLLTANQMIIGDLDLPVVLERIVEAACQLVHARYGALGVLAAGRQGLEQFVHVGIDEATARRIGHLPEGKGLLGALIDDPHPIRLHTIGDDPRSVGFPANHPQMTGFLGVPVRVREEVFGNLYLTEPEAGEFTAEDEELVTALAATAGVAIENARLYAEAQHRQEWLQASAEITRQMLSFEGEDPLKMIARHALRVADADVVTVVLPTADAQRLIVEVAAGAGEDELTGMTYPVERSLAAAALETGQPVLVGDVNQDVEHDMHLTRVVPVGPVMVVPLSASERRLGVLMVGRVRDRHRFDHAEIEMATTFANHAALALELGDARETKQRMLLLEDRDRIARDLHDHVIQQLFAAGLSVQSVASGLSAGTQSDRLNRVVDDIDDTIRQIRTSIFELRGRPGAPGNSARSEILAVVDDVIGALGFEPRVDFVGPIDTLVSEDIMDDVVATVREALTNVARHARANRCDVDVTAESGQLTIEVTDDGVGIGETDRRSGLANLSQRAEQRGGALSVTGLAEPSATSAHGPRGTRLRWTIPLA